MKQLHNSLDHKKKYKTYHSQTSLRICCKMVITHSNILGLSSSTWYIHFKQWDQWSIPSSRTSVDCKTSNMMYISEILIMKLIQINTYLDNTFSAQSNKFCFGNVDFCFESPSEGEVVLVSSIWNDSFIIKNVILTSDVHDNISSKYAWHHR